MAAAIGSGLPIRSAKGSMIIDMGGGTTEVAVIALADIVYCEAARVGGHRLDDAIINYFRRYKKFVINDATAEHLKVSIGITALWHRLRQLGLSDKKNDARRRARPPRR